jgi:hypothetical protein
LYLPCLWFLTYNTFSLHFACIYKNTKKKKKDFSISSESLWLHTTKRLEGSGIYFKFTISFTIWIIFIIQQCLNFP